MSLSLPLDALASFAALADELHFTRAAARLRIAQPALTKRIQQLERDLGVALFIRTKRSVRLTPDGELLLDRARQVLRASDELAATARRLREGGLGRLRIGFTPSAPHHVLPDLMRTFRRQHPDITCTLTEAASDEQVRQILDGDLDVGILRPPTVGPPALLCTTFLEEPYLVVLPRHHPLAPRRSIDLSELAGEAFVVIARRIVAAIHQQILGACAAAGFTPRIVQEATHIHAVVALVAAGCGISLLPASAAGVGVKDVVCRPLRRTPLRTVMAVARLRSPSSAVVRSFVHTALRQFDGRD